MKNKPQIFCWRINKKELGVYQNIQDYNEPTIGGKTATIIQTQPLIIKCYYISCKSISNLHFMQKYFQFSFQSKSGSISNTLQRIMEQFFCGAAIREALLENTDGVINVEGGGGYPCGIIRPWKERNPGV